MTNTLGIIRALLIYGLCLPLAVYLGYVLAMPLDRGNLMFLAGAILLPLIPALLRWHHVLLVLTWNMSVVLFFLPGSPNLWIVMTLVSLALTILQHILKRNVVFAHVPSVNLPLVMLILVVLITAQLTGGIGLKLFGGSAYGGKRYVVILSAILGYFALTSHRVPADRAAKYVGLYFLGAITMIVGSLAPWMPVGVWYIYALFPVESTAFGSGEFGETTRLGGVTAACLGVVFFILARHGISGLFSFNDRWRFLPLQFKGGVSINQPWRLVAFFGVIWVALMGGYRGTTVTLALTFFFLFWFEGLFRTRMLPALVLCGVLVTAISLPLIDKMPLMVQRSLSLLPIEVDSRIRSDAESSSEWRVKMWKEVLPTVPQYLLVGKGYSIDARELEAVTSLSEQDSEAAAAGAALASDFHNGPLSLIIPLGAFGALAFLWFIIAAFRVLVNNYRYGEHRRANTFLLAYFSTKTVLFLFVYGSFQNDLALFTGIVGLSAAINGGMRQPEKKTSVTKPNPAYLPFRLPKAAKA
ncbi:MAG TPA: hypothetical protein VFZ59_13460 [Verrucomicrobiae bacterium]|nr:hypothetical protein [Verrucomicrobiae bacterium]